jgi:hypothetical protein
VETPAEPPRRVRWKVLELALAGALVAWRGAAPTWHPFYFDVFFYFGLFWADLVVRPGHRSWVAATGLLMLLTFGLYLKAQMPHILVSANLLP